MKLFSLKLSMLLVLTGASALLAEINTVRLRVKGMTCEICATNIRKQLQTMSDVQSLDSVDYTDGTVQLTLKPGNKATRKQLEKAFKKRISKAGFTFDQILELQED